MKQVSNALKDDDDQRYFIEEVDLAQVPLEKYHHLTLKGLRFHTVNIKHIPRKELELIAAECEAVEKACWKAQEHFLEYVKHRDILTYVEDKGRIVAFQVASFWTMDRYFVFDLDETMVLKEYRGRSLARTLAIISSRYFYLRILKIKEIKRAVFMGLTPNTRLMYTLEKYKYVFKFIDNTFNPSPDLFKLHDTYIENKGASLVHKDYPFFLKSIYPGSQKPDDYAEKLSVKIKGMIPPNIDFRYRGDAFLFFASFSKLSAWLPLTFMMFVSFGLKALFAKKLGLLSIYKYSDFKKYFSGQPAGHNDRRSGERRKSHLTNTLYEVNGEFIERRTTIRRAIDRAG